ncbi:fimbria-like protein FimF precursor [Salmonella enterica subsp. enterica serovar Paratyphi A]|nr:fimbria-like protein FimF precursor [Salmonella enterica subsp. enterica serovar Paratyphi A]
MILRRVFITIGCVLFSPLSQANSSLGEVNIELRGNVVDFTCAVVAGDSNKSVNLGTWPTKQLHAAGDATQPVAFSIAVVVNIDGLAGLFKRQSTLIAIANFNRQFLRHCRISKRQ